MASSSFSVTSPAASVTQTSSHLPLLPTTRSPLPRRVSFRLSAKPKLRFLPKPSRSSYPVVKAQSNQVGGSGASSNASATAKREGKDESSSTSTNLATEESISEFLTQVTTLVKLVDSRDIVELQLKQLDCELVIRKKEAMPQPESPAQYVMMQQQPNQSSYVQSVAPPSAPAASPATPSTPASLPSPSPPAPAKSSLPTVKSPMAGTFYRSPGPGEPPFIKVGDKVQKGQVLCIVEAMKLMNEIESDQTGTVVDIVAEDGKPVSLDTPLFVVQP
ncbi:Biotin carboxyl carrier protein of acetyl-CoA carboxylase 1 [Hirschfeldia incana]|nr:Biotin carboxyl carrier protein of acetyl-CoA carboxylase 1 [Hirschfeldia incana]